MIKIFIIIIVLTTLIIFFFGCYFYNLAINPKTSKKSVFKNSKDKDPKKQKEKYEIKKWIFEESKSEDVYITSFDNLKLHGYKICNKQSNNWAIVVHGYCSNVVKVGSISKEYEKMSYNIIMPELRGHGNSQGDYIGMGWHDRLDIIEWIKYILNENANSNIVLHGSSMGAATVMMTSGENLPSNVKAIIADCGYTSAIDQFTYQLNSLYNIGSFPILNIASFINKIKNGYSIKDASCIKQLKKNITPILFIHGDKDDFVPYYMMNELYNNVSCYKEKLTVIGAKHENARNVNPELYWNTVKKFLDNQIK